MSSPIEILIVLIIIATCVVTYNGFTQPGFMQRYAFQVGPVRDGKEYIRLFSSGFLHVDYIHLAVNMYVLYSFGQGVGSIFGLTGFLTLYVTSLLGGSLLALWFRKNDSMYSAVGASGAVSGLVFAYVTALPKANLDLFFFIPMRAWVLGVLFLIYTLYGIKKRTGNIGHEAHLGGALIGMLVAVGLRPELARYNYWVILLLGIPTAIFLYISATRPEWLLIEKPFTKKKGGQYWSRNYSRNSPSNSTPSVPRSAPFGRKPKSDNLSLQEELDQLLDKVRLKGFDQLSNKEKDRLKALSEQLN